MSLGIDTGGLVSSISNAVIGGKNYDLAKDIWEYNKEYQKYVQQETWNREDTAVQRRASDLESAGMSKTLAAGASANSGAIASDGSATPQRAPVGGNILANIMSIASGVIDMRKKDRETELLEDTAKKMEAETSYIKSQKDAVNQQVSFQEAHKEWMQTLGQSPLGDKISSRLGKFLGALMNTEGLQGQKFEQGVGGGSTPAQQNNYTELAPQLPMNVHYNRDNYGNPIYRDAKGVYKYSKTDKYVHPKYLTDAYSDKS